VAVAQAKTVVHRHAQDDRVKVRMFPDHFQVILHGAGLRDGVVNRENAAGDELSGVYLIEVIHLGLWGQIFILDFILKGRMGR